MNRPATGLKCFHNGKPVELMYRVREVRGGEVWIVKPLFVADPINRPELFEPGDRLTPLHSQSS